MSLDITLDGFDQKLLRLIQRDNQRSHSSLGAEIGLSPSAVRRRLKRLRDGGVIAADVSLLSPRVAGETVIIGVRMEKESAESYRRFKARMLDCAEVSQCYSVSGDVDFIVIAHMADMQAYDAWIAEHLLSDPAIARSTTNIVYSRVKYETALPV